MKMCQNFSSLFIITNNNFFLFYFATFFTNNNNISFVFQEFVALAKNGNKLFLVSIYFSIIPFTLLSSIVEYNEVTSFQNHLKFPTNQEIPIFWYFKTVVSKLTTTLKKAMKIKTFPGKKNSVETFY